MNADTQAQLDELDNLYSHLAWASKAIKSARTKGLLPPDPADQRASVLNSLAAEVRQSRDKIIGEQYDRERMAKA